MSQYYLTEEDRLVHHGIKGMKWYQRLYQNPDGTYTELGKARRRRESSYSSDHKRYSELKGKRVDQLTTKELEEINRRDNAVNQYRRNHQTIGENFLSRLGPKILEKSAEAVAVAVMVNYGNKIVNKIFQRN